MDQERKYIIITGASGYIGKRLMAAFLNDGRYHVIAVARNVKRLENDVENLLCDRLTFVEVDFLERDLPEIDLPIHTVYYLMHSMEKAGEFSNAEVECAENFARWVESFSCRQIVFLGALLPEKEELSDHLKSRERVREVLASSAVPLTTLRASIIIGSGSASFEIIRDLVEKLPVMITPKWVNTECQPIAVRNVIQYLMGCIEAEDCLGRDFDIGGEEVLKYKTLLQKYARRRKLRRLLIPVPFFSPKVSSYWLQLFTAVNYSLAKALVKSLKMKTVCRGNEIREIIPQKLLTYDEAVDNAMARIAQNIVPSTWYDSLVSGKLKHHQLASIQVPSIGVYKDSRTREINCSREQCLDSIWQVGGKNGWPSMNWAWKLRGFIDKAIGGIGLRRGRRHSTELKAGEALDFWRVMLADKEEGRLILFAEMKLPGESWLSYELEGTKLTQEATFRPRGLWGRLYWFLVWPLHLIIFPRMLKAFAEGKGLRR